MKKKTVNIRTKYFFATSLLGFIAGFIGGDASKEARTLIFGLMAIFVLTLVLEVAERSLQALDK